MISDPQPPAPGWRRALSTSGPAAAFGGALLLLTARMIEKILGSFTKDFWQDPIKHNVAAYLPTGFRDLLLSIAPQDQPVLDYALRKYAVFPLLGFNERAFRTPDALSAIVALWVVVWALHRFLRRQGHPRAVSGLFAFLGGAWVVTHPLLVTYAVEGRHYMASALLSFAWFASAYLFQGRPRALFLLLTAAYANVHFFALPFVAIGLLVEGLRSWRARDKPDARLVLLSAVLIPALTIAINFPAFRQLVSQPPSPAEGGSLVHGLAEGARSWKQFLTVLGLPLGAALALLGVIASWRPARRRAFLVAFAGVGPLFLGYMRMASDYYFDPRYYLPFFGIGVVLLAFGADGLIRAARFVGGRAAETLAPTHGRTIAGVILILMVGLAFPIRDVFVETFRRWRDVRIPGRNFTDEYGYYRRIQAFPGPKLVIYRRTYVGERFVPRYYLEVDRTDADPLAEVVPDPPVPLDDGVSRVRTFWERNLLGTVVFDQPLASCAGLSAFSSRTPNAVVVRSKSRCALVVTQVESRDEMNRIAREAGASPAT